MDNLVMFPSAAGSVISKLQEEVTTEAAITETGSINQASTDDQLFEKIESHLHEKIAAGDKTAPFLLGQFYYEEELFEKAAIEFERIKDWDYQAMYQLATMLYDGIGCKKDEKRGFQLMLKVAEAKSVFAAHLKHAAQYNIGRAYFEGYGTHQSNEDAEKYFISAADDGNPKASVLSQTALGMLYSRPDFLNLKKSFFWHSEATGNGSLESQGILGVMYYEGQGIAKSESDAYDCLKEAAERGNIYAQGRLVQLFHSRKLYTKACDLARRIVDYSNPEQLANETDCLMSYVNKGIAYACFYLSRCLALGNGVRKDTQEAEKLFLRACALDPITAHDFHMQVAYGYV